MSASIHVISPVAGFGNRLDLDLVAGLLEKHGFRVTRTPVVKRTKGARLRRIAEAMLQNLGRFDLNIFLAPIFPEWLPLARKNILIPNAEGFAPHMHKYLPKIDLVLAKTRLTERVFRELGCKTEYTGFVSKDQLNEQVPRDYTRFFHACSSQYKGTKGVLDVWAKHPEWPELVAVINHNEMVPAEIKIPNVRAIRQPMSDEEIKRFQNSFAFHLCTSEAEGFGHYIMESMSCRAVVFTTDGPPMNELIDSSRGILLDCLEERPPLGLSHRYLFRPESLEQQVERAMKMDRASVDRIGAAARDYFLRSNQSFIEVFPRLIQSLAKR
jgi:glycosyltransferase involved in cell wall biosynthesis